MPGFFWGLRRTSRGKAFGNEIADSLGIRRSYFHTALEAAGVPMHLLMLAGLKDDHIAVEECRAMLLPDVLEGLRIIESRYGKQAPLTDSIKVAEYWLSEDMMKPDPIPMRCRGAGGVPRYSKKRRR